MRRLAQSALVLLLLAANVFSVYAKSHQQPPFPEKILEANTVYLDCDCRKEMTESVKSALPEVLSWGRFQVVQDREDADLIFLFSTHEYLGDYFTRDGPDKRPPYVDYTILTVIDGRTGEGLWSDSRRWGYMLVSKASRDLVQELRGQMAEQVKSWTLDDVFSCRDSSAYAGFAHLTTEEALAKSKFGVTRVATRTDRLNVSSDEAPDFCKHAQLIVGAKNEIVGFEVSPSRAETLEVTDILQQADQFSFSGGKEVNDGKVYFTVESRDKKMVMKFQMLGRVPVLVRVSYAYNNPD